jgi:outer membrane protein TolC
MTRPDYNCFSSETLVFCGKSGEHPLKKGNDSLVSSRRKPGASPACAYRSAAVAAVAALTAALGLSAGCAHYLAAPLAPAHSAEEFAARRLTDAAAHHWDRAQLLAVALTQNPDLAVARSQVAAALAREISAAQAPNPDLTLQSEYARHDPHPWLYGVSLDWLLRSPERRRLDRKIAGLDTGNARLQLMDEAWAVRSALAAALSDWESARRRQVLLVKLSAAQDRLLRLERQRVKAGEDAPSELLIHEQARIQVEQQLAQVRAAADAAQAAAAKALGLPPQALDDVVISWPEWGEPPSVNEDARRESREQALLSRADLAQAIGEYDAAEAKLQQSIARQYPQFVLSPGYYWDHGIAKFPFDVGFALPLNRNRGEIAEARAGRELAGRRMLALQAGIYGEIAAAERAENIARAGAAAAERQLDAARRQEQTADLSLRLGAADTQDQVGAEILAMRAELEMLEMRAQLQISRNRLEDVLHAPLSGPELALAPSMTSLVAGAGS